MEAGKNKCHHPVWMCDAYQPMALLICTTAESKILGFPIGLPKGLDQEEEGNLPYR
jgi:hypothetical protein